MVSKLVVVAAVAATLAGVAYAQHSQTTGTAPQAQSQTLATLPPGASTVTNWYKQDVYDPSENKIGEISDVLVDKDGKISAFIVSVGGFLVTTHPAYAVRAAAASAAGCARAWRMAVRALRPMRRPVSTIEQRAA
jgi:hypothetical protein